MCVCVTIRYARVCVCVSLLFDYVIMRNTQRWGGCSVVISISSIIIIISIIIISSSSKRGRVCCLTPQAFVRLDDIRDFTDLGLEGSLAMGTQTETIVTGSKQY